MPLLILFIIIVFFIFSIYNSLVRLRNKALQSKSSIDVYLTQRFDLIPNLVECVKGYSKFEKETLESIAKLRAEYNKTRDLEKGSELNAKCNQILAIAENYPELKASEHFLNLQKNLTKIENQLQAARRLYNSEVTNYNTKINTVPSNFFAKMLGFTEMSLFEMEAGAEKNINVKL
ncbi:MAG: LemA family protein [Clostridia bacterium]|nr:LemA family protein [Clostridia bacterium]